MIARRQFTARVERDGDRWYVVAPEVGHSTQARRLEKIESMVRDLLALSEGLPVDRFDVAIDLQLGGAQSALDEAMAARALADRSQQQAQDSTAAALVLRDSGLPLRDIGDLLGLTRHRISQLLSGAAQA